MHEKMEQMKKDTSYDDICAAKKDLLDVFLGEIHSKGAANMDTKEAGEVVDMIKDLAEAEKYCMEACYYESIVKAMHEAGEDDEDGRMGYNARHYASGRFAPKGRGTRMGYMPMNDMRDPYLYDYNGEPMIHEGDLRPMKFGYQPSGAGNRSQSGSRMGHDDRDWDMDDDPEHSREYNEYKRAKRHYTETKSAVDKQKMDEHAMKHMNQAMDSFRELWKDADPVMRKRMKTDLTALVGEMPV